MPKVLIAEDDPDQRSLLSLHLNSLNIENEYVDNIRDAKSKFRETSYDLLLLDLHLKDGSGFEIIEWLNCQDKKPGVIVLSGHDLERSQASAAGIDLFIAKPFTRHIIQLAVKEILKDN